MFHRREVCVGKDSNVEDIQKELEQDSEFRGAAHIFINNKMSQLQDDDRLVDVYQAGDILTGLGVPHDKDRSKDHRTPGDILVMADSNDKIIFLPINGPQAFKFKASEFYPSIAVFRYAICNIICKGGETRLILMFYRKDNRDQSDDKMRRTEGDDLYTGHSYEIPRQVV